MNWKTIYLTLSSPYPLRRGKRLNAQLFPSGGDKGEDIKIIHNS
jgi:hypothetical protein